MILASLCLFKLTADHRFHWQWIDGFKKFYRAPRKSLCLHQPYWSLSLSLGCCFWLLCNSVVKNSDMPRGELKEVLHCMKRGWMGFYEVPNYIVAGG